ncbi:MAG: PSD1 domain-containing protein [Planctomycetaceae bacterium]|nr:PSD1 domain-containing protein [Planctomycetaceae bacterium]
MKRWPLLLLLCVLNWRSDDSLMDNAAADEKPAVTVPSFDKDVRPLLQAKCGRCHGEEVRKGELALHTPAGIRKGSESGPVLMPGQSAKSRLYELVRDGEMPPDKKNPLTKAEVEIIRRWIDGGARFDNETAATKLEVTQHDIVPILLLRCTACHGRQKREGGLDLRTRAAMLRGGKSGPVFVSGKPEESLILKRLQREEMPPRQRLVEAMVKPMEATEIEKLTRWIVLGAPEVADEPDVAGTPADPLVSAEDREFWSFQRPQKVTVPDVEHATRVRNPVDAFVLKKLEEKGLSLSAEADRLTLLRRAAFDLTGLPPEPAEADAFFADDDPRAFEKLIDRLLASPRYGERWGRHWLDVAGYADCEGRREQHLPRPSVWRYRDYVIRSFSADKPYDRFLQEQLAGDELADYEHALEITQEIEDNLVATAFLRMAPDPTWANLTGFVPDRLEVMADSMDVLGSGVMGLTFKCARCHSHKFDPIPQRDYYRLVAIFKGAYDEHDWLKPQLIGFGGALSASFGERYLPQVTTTERKRIDEHNTAIQRDIDTLKAGTQTPEIAKQINELAAKRLPDPRLFTLWDRGEPSPSYIYRRGDYQISGTLVAPGPPAVLTDGRTSFEIAPPWPDSKSTGRRLAFARWLTQPDSAAGGLTTRVLVNRVWKHHFGQGLVRSVGNFGKTGDRPTHPELLDWLAQEFIRQRWSLKEMHRLMMTSSVYRQVSAETAEPSSPNQQSKIENRKSSDPDNRLLSRMPLRRMEAELLRDSLLLVAGQLDETRFGPADPVQVRPDGLVLSGKRRSVYVQQLRKHPASLLESFDLPAMNPNCLQRAESLVAPQALHLMNDAAVRELARQFADRVQREAGDDPKLQVQRAYRIALTRPPNDEELAACLQTLKNLTEQWTKQSSAAEASRKALATLCHTIMNSASFLYVD